ncbi:GNAT family N-acetyltransferase [Planobispora takensis]|uniref:Ribosomal-protein-alanine N-acetyltransferase n=1 Tax=Planobispora takensis TaxID=1367882 RepID=A0A8J3WYD6_9ACTN|nr:GNAT family N-acetyltransferase [Planobispora takensis]GII05843.1 ribosomal-protein-alanine N-acetyltransferase [Planobispora takensis]
MSSARFTPGMDKHAVMITRVAETQWHAVEDDLTVGRGYTSLRPDGRMFLSIDAWHGAAFDRLAETMLADLPRPLYTVADGADLDLVSDWERAGFTMRRREWEYLVPTDPQVTGLGSAPPAGVTIVAVGRAERGPLLTLERVIREEVEATVGWREMPAEVPPRPDGATTVDPSQYAVAAQGDEYVGLLRVTTVLRQPRCRRIGLIAVRSGRQRRGVARALLAHVLGSLHRCGIEAASADVNESNGAAVALFEGVGARRVNSSLELVLR